MKIVVGGQIDKQKIADFIVSVGGEQVSVTVSGDIQAAMEVKSGNADYYIGACNTGGGGALAMAIAILGLNQCATLSMPGNVKSEAEIAGEVAAGKKAFGFTAQHMDLILPVLMKHLLSKQN
ncbi:MAG: DUF2620 domain-containing protein [Fusobacteriaceae bacterium]|nr:DUF2620 domain-containing protein [Fusobacteriaceae bacterium]